MYYGLPSLVLKMLKSQPNMNIKMQLNTISIIQTWIYLLSYYDFFYLFFIFDAALLSNVTQIQLIFNNRQKIMKIIYVNSYAMLTDI